MRILLSFPSQWVLLLRSFSLALFSPCAESNCLFEAASVTRYPGTIGNGMTAQTGRAKNSGGGGAEVDAVGCSVSSRSTPPFGNDLSSQTSCQATQTSHAT